MSVLILVNSVVVLLVLVMFLKSLRLKHSFEPVEPVELIKVDKEIPARHLSEAIRIKTISQSLMEREDYKPFLQFHSWLEKTYPKAHAVLQRKIINEFSLLYLWQGLDTSLKPVLFSSHMDVVPVERSTMDVWQASPFKGEIKNGFVWGRGALDMKHQVVANFESIERLVEMGYQPKRSIYVTIGHDEEISGKNGARQIAVYLKRKGVRLAALLDEGGMVSQGMIPGVDQEAAFIGIGEKEYLTLDLSAKGSPGHSSNPPRQTAIGVIARALALLDDNRMPARLNLILLTLEGIASLLPFQFQFALANSWIFKPVIIKLLEKQTQTNALIRTTHASTVIKGGIKDNVLPAEASAKVNFRLLPGDTHEKVLKHIHSVISDARVKITIDEADAWGACKVSPIQTPAYNTLELIIRQVFGNIPVAPLLLIFATDARHYQEICDHLYHFSPLRVAPEDMKRLHGVNERISVDELAKMVQFFARLLRVWGDAEF